MVDEATAAEDAQELDESEVELRPGSGGLSGKKLVLFIVLPILLLIGGGAGAYFSGLLDPLIGAEKPVEGEQTAEAEVTPSVYYEMPEMLVNLNTGKRRSAYLKISISLELAGQEHLDQINTVLPRIVDTFHVYLRELRVEDLGGSAGMQRLREELLVRVNAAAHPAEVRDVLFREMLIQ